MSGKFSYDIRFNVTDVGKNIRFFCHRCHESSAIISDVMIQLSGKFSHKIEFSVTAVRKIQP